MKRILFLSLGVFCFMTPAIAKDQAPAAPLDRDALVGLAIDSVESNPQWRSPVSGIEQTIQSLLETNQALTQEYRDLNERILAVQADIEAQQNKNAQDRAALPGQQKNAADPQGLGQLKAKVAQVEKEIADEKAVSEGFRLRIKDTETALSLWQLKIKESGIQKEALVVDKKAYEQNIVGELRYAVADLQAKVDAANGQDQYFQEKLAKLKDAGSPYLQRIKQLSEENAALRKSLEERVQKKAQDVETLNAMAHKRTALQSDKKTQRYFHLTEVSDQLVAKIAEQNVRKEELSQTFEDAKAEKVDESEDKETEELIAQNKKLQQDLAQLRENIAILEYGISSLQRYKDRNRKEGK